MGRPVSKVITDVAAAFAARTTPEPNTGCLIWLGTLDARGYGVLKWEAVADRQVFAHRLAWELAHGPLDPALHIDHKCRNRWCVNERHLRPVTPTVNALENSLSLAAINAQKVVCIRGHPFDKVTKDGKRQCKTCNALRERMNRAGTWGM